MKLSGKIVFTLIIATLFIIIMFTNRDNETKNSKPTVAVTTFALYDIVKNISADSVKIVNILPFGVDPHSFEPTPKLMADTEKSSLIIYSGAGLEPWTHGFSFKNRVIDMSKYVELRELGEDEVHEHHHGGDENTKIDPHYWLSFSNMSKIAKIVTNELIKILPSNEQLYKNNRDKYLKMLHKLDVEFTNGLSSCDNDTIVVNHNAFGYLTEKYNFHVESLSGLSPEAQPSAKNIIRLIHIIKEHNVSTVFFESFASDRAINSIANEAHVKVDVLQPLGNITADEAKKKLTYQEMMQENLFKLSKALSCH